MKKLNRILFYSLLFVYSCFFYGCVEDLEIPTSETIVQGNGNSNNEEKFKIIFVNGSEDYLDEKGNLRISFTYRAEEKLLSFIANEDWIINIDIPNQDNITRTKLSDWLTVTFDNGSNVNISETEYGIQIFGKKSNNCYTLKLITEENQSTNVYRANIGFRSQTVNNDIIGYTTIVNIIKGYSLIEEHNLSVNYAGGMFKLLSYDGLEYKVNDNWININSENRYLQILFNETGAERKAKIVLSESHYGFTDTLYVKQSATKVFKQVNVSIAGTMQYLLTAEEKYQITDLIVTGNINGDDIRYIREMGGEDYAGDVTQGTLVNLDLLGANIISGGKPYTHNKNTSNNIVGAYMFSGLSLVSIILPNSVYYIDEYAFAGCSNLSLVKFPSNIESIKANAFSGCISLQSIDIPNGVTAISYQTFSGCSNLKHVKMSDDVKIIDELSFENCFKLSSIVIPNKVTTIGLKAFKNCIRLKEMTLPQSITTLSGAVFMGCTSMTKIRCLAIEPLLLSFTIGIEKNATLYVPKESLAKYKDAAVWKNFKNIVGE